MNAQGYANRYAQAQVTSVDHKRLLILVFEGLRRPRSRAATCFGVAAAFAIIAIAAHFTSRAYGVQGPLARLGDGVMRVLTQPTDTRVENSR